MKKKMSLKLTGMFMVLFFGAIILSCNNQEFIDVPEAEISLKSEHLDAMEVVCDLTAGQTMYAGNVVYEYHNGDIIVTYAPSNGWLLREVHLFVGCKNEFPVNGKAIQIGHFPYGNDKLNDVDSWSSGPITLPVDCEDCIIAAHAVVYNESMNKEETAWANCTFNPVIALKVRCQEHPCDNTNSDCVLTEGVRYIDEFKGGSATGNWCDNLGYNYYIKGDEYKLQSAYCDDAGKVTVTDDNKNLIVAVESTYELDDTYLFVGSLYELGKIVLRYDGCPDYNDFPFVKNGLSGNTTEYTIPLADIGMNMSVSFKDEFGSNRWGWFSYCN
jgi:hypothetical protein